MGRAWGGAGAASSAGRKRKGLLGVDTGCNSESDEDYEPAQQPEKKPRKTPQRAARARRTAAAAAPPATSDTDSEADSGDRDSSAEDSDETLAVRQQRKLSQQSPAQGPAQSRRRTATTTSTSRGARAAAAAAPAARDRSRASKDGNKATTMPQQQLVTTWDQLPTAVLAQIFLGVCKHGALPMAPRLACVCTSFNAAVAATPELFRVLDTAVIPAKAWAQPSGSARSPQGSKRGKGRSNSSRGARVMSASEGLRHWLATGRLAQLQALLLYGEGGSAGSAGAQDGGSSAAAAAGGGGGGSQRQLGAGLLMDIADSCQELARVSMFGVFSLRPEEVCAALLCMPSLSELWLCGVRFSSLTGLNTCLCSVLDAAAASGHPQLRKLVVEDCISMGQKVVNSLCPGAAEATPQPQPDAAGVPGDGGHPQQQEQPGSPHSAAAGGQAAGAAVPGGQLQIQPRFAQLEVLDLSRSVGLSGRPVKFQLDDMQAAMPNLRVLKLSALGGHLYGWLASVRAPASLPGWPALESLHVDAAPNTAHASSIGRRLLGYSSVDNTLLLHLAGKSVRLQALDLSGCSVGPAGLLALAGAHAALRAEQAGGGQGGRGSVAAAAVGSAHNADAPAAAAGPSAGAGDAALPSATAGAHAALRVRDLQLDGSALATDEGLIAVGQFCCDTLEQLVVRNAGSKLGDAGIRGLKGCTRLSTLDITGCSVTEQGLADLLSALPAGVLEELHLESCRSVSRAARQAAAHSIAHLQQYLADNKGCSDSG